MDRYFLPLLQSHCCFFDLWPGPRVFCLPTAEVALILRGFVFTIHSRHLSGAAVNHTQVAVSPVFPLDKWWRWPWWDPEGWW